MPLSDFYPQLEGWTPVEPSKAALPSPPQEPEQVITINPRLRTTVPMPYQYPPDTLRQYNRPDVSSFRVSPVAPAGIAAVNSATISTAKAAFQTGASQISLQIGLDVPNIFTPLTQVVNTPGPLSFSVAPETSGLVWASPPLAGQTNYLDYVSSNSVLGTSLTLNATASGPDLAIYTAIGAYGSSPVYPTGYNNIVTSGNAFVGWKLLPAGSSSATYSYTASGTSLATSAGIVLFSAPAQTIPTFTVIGSDSGGLSGTIPISCTIPTGTPFLTLHAEAGGVTTSGASGAVTTVVDGHNTWYQLCQTAISTGAGDGSGAWTRTYVSVWFCVNPVAGTYNISPTITVSGAGVSITSAGIQILSCNEAIVPVEGVPSFRRLTLTDLPSGAAGTNYQTVEQAGSAKPQEPTLNFLSPVTIADNAGNASSDVTVPVFVASGPSHATGLVPDPGSTAGTTHFLREDATWATPGGGGGIPWCATSGWYSFFTANNNSGLLAAPFTLTTGAGWDVIHATTGGGVWNASVTASASVPYSSQIYAGAANTTCGYYGASGSNLTWSFDYKILNFATESYMMRTTDVLFYAGLFTNSSVGNTLGGTTIAAATKGAYFRFDTTASDTTVQCITSDGTTQTITNSGKTPDTNGHNWAISIVGGSSATFYYDGVQVAQNTTHLPTGLAEFQVTLAWHTATLQPIMGNAWIYIAQ